VNCCGAPGEVEVCWGEYGLVGGIEYCCCGCAMMPKRMAAEVLQNLLYEAGAKPAVRKEASPMRGSRSLSSSWISASLFPHASRFRWLVACGGECRQ